ncbi:hypothetical protein KY308_00740 [Candidatus Woesearchaeota archaeon]|nr:hypothetical protein [Candidatus Woesearchaeota archaeon]
MYYIKQPKVYKLWGKVTTSDKEITDLLKAWLAISVAFAIVLSPSGLMLTSAFLLYFAVAAIGVGTGFLFHELGHKIVAQRYGCFAEFRANYTMLVLAIFMSFFGFVFAAPGAVMIAGGHLDFRRSGKIAVTGPLINLGLSAIFLGLAFIYPHIIFLYGMLINAWLGVFNLIPAGFFDGKKIFLWSKTVYILTAVIGVGLIILSSSIFYSALQ